MNISIEAQIRCPFYIREKTDVICCEGFIKGTCMTTKFPSRKEKMVHVRKFCFLETGGRCPMAAELNEMYRRAEEKEREEAIKKASAAG